jgi:L-iditol 2-dehydrogenase
MGNRAAILYGVHDIRVEDIPTPVPARHEVPVRVTSVGVCGSDVHYYEHGRIGPYIVQRPLILGHETAGVVADLGESATKHAVGDRVALEPGVPCGRCRECRSGRYNLCHEVRFFGTPRSTAGLRSS